MSGLRERDARDGADTPARHRRRRPAAPPATSLHEELDDEHDAAPTTPVPPGRRLDVFA